MRAVLQPTGLVLTMQSTYTSLEVNRGTQEFGEHRVVRQETVCDNGLVLVHVTGTSDGERVDHKHKYLIETPVDFARIEAYRLAHGWTIKA